jgi:putative NADH-flavin reductase
MTRTTGLQRLLWLAVLLTQASYASEDVPPREGLEILVYGATGKVGTYIVDEALARGHNVTAVSRDPSQIEKQHPNLAAAAGDLLDPESIAQLLSGKDVVITSVRGVIGNKKDGRNSLQYIAVVNVVKQLRQMGDAAPRLIHVGGSGTLEVEPGELYADKLPGFLIPKGLEIEIEGQILALEYLRAIDDIEWSYATPAKNFTGGKRTGVFRVGGDQAIEDDRGKTRISRADFAVAILDEAELETHTGRRFSVAY